MNTPINSFINFLDAKANIDIWKSDTEMVFDGKVYQLYEGHEELKKAKIKDIKADFSSMTILID